MVRLERLQLLIALGTYFCVLCVNYVNVVSVYYGYMGFGYSPEPIKVTEAILSIVFISLLIPLKSNRPSVFFANINLLAFFIPSSVFYCLADSSRVFYYSVFFMSTAFYIARCFPEFKVPVFRGGPVLGSATLPAIIFFSSILFVWSKIGFENLNFSVSGGEYEYRELIGGNLGGGPINYLLGWVTVVIGPLALCLALSRGRPLASALIFVGHLLFFMIAGHKTALGIPFVIFGLWILREKIKRAVFLVSGFLAIPVVSALEFGLNKSYLFSAFVERRVLFIPPLLAVNYYEFFLSRPKLWWAALRRSEAPFTGELSDGVERAIGAYMGIGGYPNAGFYATGYINGGFLGLVIYASVVVFILALTDSLSMRGRLWGQIVLTMSVPVLTLFTSSDLFTTLISHGLALSLLAVFLMRGTNDFPPQNRRRTV